MTLRYGWYGDDFTGATDTLATLARDGRRALLFLDVPNAAQLERAGALDAIGIAGAARAMDPGAMERELDPVGAFFARMGVPVLHYKTCSTFDSAPHVGSIGTAIRVLNRHIGNPFVPIVGGQPNIGRYCLFGTLFASAGTGGAVHRLDRHPTMSVHPVTPMNEPDLRRHLAAQGISDIGLVPYLAYGRSEVSQLGGPVLFDVGDEPHLSRIGRIIWRAAQERPLLAVGPSSVAQAIASQWEPASSGGPDSLGPAKGPVFALAGSLSPVTRRQIAAARSFEPMEATPQQLIGDPAGLAERVAGLLRDGRHTLLWTAAADAGTAPGEVAAATAALVAAVLRAVPVRRVGIAGGDTSSRAVKTLGAELGVWGLSYRSVLAPGVAVCHVHAEGSLDGMELMLKGGQMGPEDLFERLL